MQEQAIQRPHCTCRIQTPSQEDTQVQQAVMAFILSQHPAALTFCEVVREIASDDDGAERAIRDLVGAGLLRCEGASVLPTRAAIHFDRLAA